MQWNYLQVTNKSQLQQKHVHTAAFLHLFAIRSAVAPIVIQVVAGTLLAS